MVVLEDEDTGLMKPAHASVSLLWRRLQSRRAGSGTHQEAGRPPQEPVKTPSGRADIPRPLRSPASVVGWRRPRSAGPPHLPTPWNRAAHGRSPASPCSQCLRYRILEPSEPGREVAVPTGRRETAPPDPLHSNSTQHLGLAASPRSYRKIKGWQPGARGMEGAKCVCRCRRIRPECGYDRACGRDRRRRPDRADVGGRARIGGHPTRRSSGSSRRWRPGSAPC